LPLGLALALVTISDVAQPEPVNFNSWGNLFAQEPFEVVQIRGKSEAVA